MCIHASERSTSSADLRLRPAARLADRIVPGRDTAGLAGGWRDFRLPDAGGALGHPRYRENSDCIANPAAGRQCAIRIERYPGGGRNGRRFLCRAGISDFCGDFHSGVPG